MKKGYCRCFRLMLVLVLTAAMLPTPISMRASAEETVYDYTLALYNGKGYKNSWEYGTPLPDSELKALGITASGSEADGFIYTFHNVNFKTTKETAIEFGPRIGDQRIVVSLSGNNQIQTADSSPDGIFGMVCYYTGLTLCGSGSLTINSGKSTEDSTNGLFVLSDLIIDGCSLDVRCQSGYREYVSSGIRATELTIRNSTVRAFCYLSNENYSGIVVDGSSARVSNSTVLANGSKGAWHFESSKPSKPVIDSTSTVEISNNHSDWTTVTNPTLSTYTENAFVQINPPSTIITKQPMDASARVGDTLTYSVSAKSAGSYEWIIYATGDENNGFGYRFEMLLDHADFSGENTNTLKIKLKDDGLDGMYVGCTVSSEEGVVFSNRAKITVLPASDPLIITSQPESQTVEEGGTVTFTTAVKGGNNPYTYQWYCRLAGYKTVSTLDDNPESGRSGTQTPSLTLSKRKASYSGNRYWCVIRDQDGNEITTNSATLTVTKAEEPVVVNPHFIDVNDDDYFRDAVDWAVEAGVTSGTSDTTFSPNESCTRAQAVTFLWRANASPTVSTTNPFKDVSSSDYYYQAVLWAVEEGITVGMSDTTFSPNDTCTRGQIVTFLWRSFGSPSPNITSNAFYDVNAADYYYEPVLWAVEKGITAGMSETSFEPNTTCTRAQIVTFLYRSITSSVG